MNFAFQEEYLEMGVFHLQNVVSKRTDVLVGIMNCMSNRINHNKANFIFLHNLQTLYTKNT